MKREGEREGREKEWKMGRKEERDGRAKVGEGEGRNMGEYV